MLKSSEMVMRAGLTDRSMCTVSAIIAVSACRVVRPSRRRSALSKSRLPYPDCRYHSYEECSGAAATRAISNSLVGHTPECLNTEREPAQPIPRWRRRQHHGELPGGPRRTALGEGCQGARRLSDLRPAADERHRL